MNEGMNDLTSLYSSKKKRSREYSENRVIVKYLIPGGTTEYRN
jgi:hypothetical protein